MIDIIITFLSYAKLLMTFSLFTYIYKYFYDSCHEKKIIKSKSGEPKKIVKIRTGLTIFYLILLSLFFYSLNWYVLITFVFTILLLGTAIIHKLDPSVLYIFKKYDSSPIFIKLWFIFSLIFNTIFKFLSPCHQLIDNKIKKIKTIIQNKVFGPTNDIKSLNFDLLNNMSNMSNISNMSNMSNMTTMSNMSNMSTIHNEFNVLQSFFEGEINKDNKLK